MRARIKVTSGCVHPFFFEVLKSERSEVAGEGGEQILHADTIQRVDRPPEHKLQAAADEKGKVHS